AARRTSETMELVSGSIRVRVVLSSVSIQTLSGLDATADMAVPEPVPILATGFAVAVSTRARDFAPQSTTHKLRNALAIPPQGLAIPENGSNTLLDFPSTRRI